MKVKSNRLTSLFAVLALCNAVAAMVLINPLKAKGCEISNDYLVLRMQEDKGESNYGGFILLKNDGENTETLTYSRFYSSFASFNINGTVKRFGDGDQIKAPYTEKDGSVVAVQDFNGIEITQKLSFSTGNSERADMLRIEYEAENKTDSDALISAELIIDPTLSGSESDFIQADGTAFENEITLNGDSVPDSWCIKDEQGSISAYGITSGSDISPDTFMAANWHNLYNNRNGYRTESGTAITDNAVALNWSDVKLSAGENFSCSTKYGLYSEKGSTIENGNKGSVSDSPKTGDNAGYIFVILAACSGAAAVLSRKRRNDINE